MYIITFLAAIYSSSVLSLFVPTVSHPKARSFCALDLELETHMMTAYWWNLATTSRSKLSISLVSILPAFWNTLATVAAWKEKGSLTSCLSPGWGYRVPYGSYRFQPRCSDSGWRSTIQTFVDALYHCWLWPQLRWGNIVRYVAWHFGTFKETG